MKATILHNPRCGTSRNTLAMLEATPGIELTVIDYLKTPPSRAELQRLYAQAGLSPHQGLRMKEDAAAALADASDDEVLDAMAAHPILIERPIVFANGKAVIGRPPENVFAIL